MKLNKILWMAALPLAFVACQDDNEMLEQVAQTGQVVHTLKAGMSETMSSRAQIIFGNEDESIERFAWNANDQFAVYSQTTFDVANPAIFSIVGYSDECPDSWGDFTTESNALMVGDKVTAFYPVSAIDENGYAQLDIPDADFVNGSDEEWREYFAKHLYLMAITTLDNPSERIHFEHQTAIMRVTYSNNTYSDQKITTVIIDGHNTSFLRARNANMKDGGQNSSGHGNWLQNNFSDLTVPAGETKDFYFLLLGETQGEYAEGSSLVIRLATDKGSYVTPELPMATIAEANDGVGHIEKGKRYWFAITQTEDGLVWSKDIENSEPTNGSGTGSDFVSGGDF